MQDSMVSTVMRINERKDTNEAHVVVGEGTGSRTWREYAIHSSSLLGRSYPRISISQNASLRCGAHPADLVGTRSRHNEIAPRATAGQGRRRARNSPRSVTRGHYPQGSLQEVQGFHEFSLHPHS